jgi:hypothetical protein
MPPLDVAPEGDVTPTFGPILRRSIRMMRPTEQYQQYLYQRKMDLAEELSESEEADKAYYDALHEDNYRIQDEMKDHVRHRRGHNVLIPGHEGSRPTTLCGGGGERGERSTTKHWVLIPRLQFPKGVKVLDSVWSMKRKRNIKTRKIYNHTGSMDLL